MNIDIERLGPAARKQILEKLGAQAAAKAAEQKYHNEPTERVAGDGRVIKFRSRLEARRYDELTLLLKAGKIAELKLQPEWTLQEAYTTPDGKRVRAIRYVADFSYRTPAGAFIVEDTKSQATKTRVYGIKKKLMLEKFGIEIVEVE